MTNGTTMLLNDPAFAMQRLTTSYTFSTGVQVKLLKASPTLYIDIERALRQGTPAPTVPINEVDMGGDGPVAQENPLDPAYQEAVRRYEADIQSEALQIFVDALIEEAIIIEGISEAEMEAAVARREAVLAKVSAGKVFQLSGVTPKIRYMRHIANAGKELDQVLDIIVGRSTPTEAQIRAHEATFQGNVQGEAAENGL